MINQKSKFLIIFLSFVFIASSELWKLSSCELFAQESSKEEEALFVAKKAFEDGFYDVSLGLFERFLNNYPASEKKAEVNLLIGQCYFHQNRFMDALAKFEEQLNSPAAEKIKDAVLYWVAEVHFRGNDFNRAATYYQKIIDEFPKSSYIQAAYYSLGWCLFQEEKFSEALHDFKIIEEKFPKEPVIQDTQFKIIECLYNLKDYNGLKEKINYYIKAYPKDTAKLTYLYFYDAEADYYLNNFSGAINGYSKVLDSTSDDKMQALSRLGEAWAYLKLKRYQEAQDTFSQIKTDNLGQKNLEVLLLGRAILAFETNKFSQAQDTYNDLINKTQDPVVLIQAHLGKADALYNIAEYEKAIAAYKEGLAKVTDDIPQEIIDKLYYGVAWTYLKEGEFKEAIDAFQKIAKHSEDKIVKISALCQIGDVYQNSGEYQKASEAYDKILKDYPDSFYSDYVQYQIGMTLLKSSNYDGAIMAFKSLKANFPESKLLDDASYALGISYFQREDYASSKEIFAKFQQEFKESNLKPQATYLLGTNLYNLGKFAEAIEVFKDIIRTYSQDIELVQKAEYEIADCFYQMGNEKEAMARFKALRSKYPDSKLTVEIIWWLGEYYYRHNELNLAHRYFSSLIQDFPKSNLVADAYYALGSINAEEGTYPEAIGNFQKVLELGKSDLAAQAAVAIGDMYLKQEQIDSALKTYKDVVREYPNFAQLIYPKIADIYNKTGNYDEAQDYYRKSLDMVPVKETSSIQFKIAEVLQAQGKLQEAIEEYLKVTYLYSENNDLTVKALLRVAAIYEDKENFNEAMNIYRKIVAMNVGEAKYAEERMDWIKTHVK